MRRAAAPIRAALTRPATALSALVLVGGLAACSGDDEKAKADPTDPVTVELGEEFTWNGFTVPAGWEITTAQHMMGIDEATKPMIEHTISNNEAEARFAVFELVFADGNERVSTIHCVSRKELPESGSGELFCDGVGQPVPEGYDQIVAQPITRD